MHDIYKNAGLSTAEYFRECRKEILRRRPHPLPKDWYTDPHKLRTLVLYLIDQCGDRDEIVAIVDEALAKPWNWRTEYIVAKCREAGPAKGKAGA